MHSFRQTAFAAPAQWPQRVWVAVDCAAAAVLALLLIAWSGNGHAQATPAWAADVLALAAGAGVALRRLAPLPCLAVTLAASVTSYYLGFAQDPMIAVALVLYVVATRARPGLAAGALIVAEMAVLVTWHATAYVPNLLPRVAATAIVQAAAWTIGLTVRTQRRYAQGLREQAERRVQAEADRSRRALAEERLRIARELHDMVAHTMGVIAVQAGTAGHVASSRPAEAGKALRTIEETSRSALHELRRMLTVLRDGTSASAAADLTPAPGLRDLPGLIERTRATGLRVELAQAGEPGDLAEGTAQAAYRIAQEALANIVRHARARHARVELDYEPAGLRLTVTDDGTGSTGSPAPPEGHGLQGMRERAALCGGDFTAGPRPGGGYQVRAFLPVIPVAAGRDRP